MNPASPNTPFHTPLCSGEVHVSADRCHGVIPFTEGGHQDGIRRASR